MRLEGVMWWWRRDDAWSSEPVNEYDQRDMAAKGAPGCDEEWGFYGQRVLRKPKPRPKRPMRRRGAFLTSAAWVEIVDFCIREGLTINEDPLVVGVFIYDEP